MTASQNGWPLLASDSTKLHTWVIPARSGAFRLRLRNGSAGFLLAHFALWFAEKVQPVAKVADDWGYAPRPIRGSSVPSNHGSGTAMDLNATAHVLGAAGTFAPSQVAAIHSRLLWLRGAIRWGGDYQYRKDEMHFEIVQSLAFCERRARRLSRTPRGRRLLRANKGQRAVIFS
jgi:hypothetical protein